ncbi:hypothetical protein D3C73_1272430 [compost metagenome]
MEYIGYRNNFGVEMNLGTLQMQRITRTVYFLMMLKCSESDSFINCRNIAQQLVTIGCMSADLF